MKPASPTINEVLARFIADEDPPSHDPFTSRGAIADCIRSNLDMYGHAMLTPKKATWATEKYNEDEETGSFCNLFGPEFILRSFDDFLGYFMVAKMMGPPEMTAAAGPVCLDLATWMATKGLATQEEADEAAAIATGATTSLPAAEAAGYLIHEHWTSVEREPRVDVLEWNDAALVTRVENEAIWFVDKGSKAKEFGPVVVPADAALLIEPGWVINWPVLVKTASGWHIAESGFIYTDASRFD